MVKHINAWMLTFALAFFPAIASAQSPQIRQLLLKPSVAPAVASGYTGPGDIVSGAFAWYSCSRGYNSADTSNACNVCLPSDTTCADLTLTSGFAVVPGSLSTCNITTVICTVKTAFDKTGNGRDVTNATIANRPTFRPAMASNGCPTTALPCMLFTAANSQTLISAAITLAQPFTMSLVLNNTAANGDIATSADNAVALVRFGSNNISVFASALFGSRLDITATDAAWHAGQFVYNGSSNAGYVDGSTTSGGNTGTAAFSSTALRISTNLNTSFWGGSLAEFGLWGVAFNSTQAGNMNTNQHGSTNGYNF